MLDLAAGYADVTRSSIAARKVAIDSNPTLPELVGDDIEAIVGDATDLSAFADGEFTTVIASNFVEHLDHDAVDALLDGIHRVLASGGHLILIQPNFRLAPRRYFDDYTHRTIWTDASLGDLLVAHGYRLDPGRGALPPTHDEVPVVVRSPARAAVSPAAVPSAGGPDAGRRRTSVNTLVEAEAIAGLTPDVIVGSLGGWLALCI